MVVLTLTFLLTAITHLDRICPRSGMFDVRYDGVAWASESLVLITNDPRFAPRQSRQLVIIPR
jgi:hypothetical protein